MKRGCPVQSAFASPIFFVCVQVNRACTQVRKIVISWLSRLVLTYDCKKEMETALHGQHLAVVGSCLAFVEKAKI